MTAGTTWMMKNAIHIRLLSRSLLSQEDNLLQRLIIIMIVVIVLVVDAAHDVEKKKLNSAQRSNRHFKLSLISLPIQISNGLSQSHM